jgi:hypothetical protein
LQTAVRWDDSFNNNAQWRLQQAVSGSFGNVSIQRTTETHRQKRLQSWICDWKVVSAL